MIARNGSALVGELITHTVDTIPTAAMNHSELHRALPARPNQSCMFPYR